MQRAIRQFIGKLSHGRATSVISLSLAQDIGLPADVVTRVLDQAAADLRNLEPNGSGVQTIIKKAVTELKQHDLHSQPFDTAAMDRCLKELAEPDLAILRHFKEGMKHADIAALLGTDVESVRRSLVRTYADLRIKMMGWDDGDGGGDVLLADSNHKRTRAFSRH